MLQLIDDALATHPGLAQTLRKGIWRSNSSNLRGADSHGQAAAPGVTSSSSGGSAGGARQGTGAAASAQAAVQHAGEHCSQAAATAVEKLTQGDGMEAAGVLQQVLEIAFSWLAFEMQVRASTHLLWRPSSGLSELLAACLVSTCAAPGCQLRAQLAGVRSRAWRLSQGPDSVQSGALRQCHWKLLAQELCISPVQSTGQKMSSSNSSGRVSWPRGRPLYILKQPHTGRPGVDIFMKAAYQAPRLTSSMRCRSRTAVGALSLTWP